MFHPDLPNFACVGLAKLTGPQIVSNEIQAMYLSLIFSNQKSLPPREHMLQEISDFQKDFAPYYHFGICASYCETLAAIIGCKPRASHFPELANALVLGPCIPISYRIEGPFKIEGALESFVREVQEAAPEWLSNDALVEWKDVLKQLLPQVGADFEPDFGWLLERWEQKSQEGVKSVV